MSRPEGRSEPRRAGQAVGAESVCNSAKNRAGRDTWKAGSDGTATRREDPQAAGRRRVGKEAGGAGSTYPSATAKHPRGTETPWSNGDLPVISPARPRGDLTTPHGLSARTQQALRGSRGNIPISLGDGWPWHTGPADRPARRRSRCACTVPARAPRCAAGMCPSQQSCIRLKWERVAVVVSDAAPPKCRCRRCVFPPDDPTQPASGRLRPVFGPVSSRRLTPLPMSPTTRGKAVVRDDLAGDDEATRFLETRSVPGSRPASGESTRRGALKHRSCGGLAGDSMSREAGKKWLAFEFRGPRPQLKVW